MKPNTKRKLKYVAAGLTALLLAPMGAALARPEACIKDDTKCDKNLLCSFKIELAEKILLYETYVANTPATKKAPKSTSQGVKYNGKLYDAALKEAKAENADASAEDLASAAYEKFNDKVRAKLAAEASKYEDCSSLKVTPSKTHRGTWSGMHTDKADCNVFGEIGTGKDRTTHSLDDTKDMTDGCLEVWQSDRGHEAVHQDFCYKRKGKKIPESVGLQGYIDEDISAYRYSVQHAAGDLQKLQLLCSTDPTTDEFRARADELLKKALQYQQNQAGTP
jgi:hypothetical protein